MQDLPMPSRNNRTNNDNQWLSTKQIIAHITSGCQVVIHFFKIYFLGEIMGKHLQKLYSFRADDDLMLKVNYIADINTRTRNKEIEHVLKTYVNEYESEHGQLIVGEDGSVSIAKPTPVSKDKSSSSKTG
ncbi:MAG: hypothetical protein WCD89_04060 [Anaerocolumna sp.]